MARGLTQSKAGKILKHGSVMGHKLTSKQKGFMGLIRGGGSPSRLKGGKSKFKRMRR